MQRRPGPTITDSSLGGSETPSMVGSAPRFSQPALGQGRPSQVRTAGTGFFAIAGGGCALLLVLGGIAALVAYLVDPRSLDMLIGGGRPPRMAASARGTASARPLPSASAKPRPSR